MKPKSKLFTAILIACTLVLVFTACAGCIDSSVSNDPIVGTYSSSADSPKEVLKFYPDGTLDYYSIDSAGNIEASINSWKKTGNNLYESMSLQTKLSEDNSMLTRSDNKGNSRNFYRVSESAVPTIAPLYGPSSQDQRVDPIVGLYCAKNSDGNTVVFEFFPNGEFNYYNIFPDENIRQHFGFPWMKYSRNYYETTDLINFQLGPKSYMYEYIVFQLSEDKNTLKISDRTLKPVLEAKRIDIYEFPPILNHNTP